MVPEQPSHGTSPAQIVALNRRGQLLARVTALQVNGEGTQSHSWEVND